MIQFLLFLSFLFFRNHIHKTILYALRDSLKKEKKTCLTSHADIISSYFNLFSLSSTSKTAISEYI